MGDVNEKPCVSKIYRSYVMEVRPNLQSVNVFVVLLNVNSKINVTLHINEIEIAADGNTEKISCTGFNIVLDSLNYFDIKGKCVSFRFSTNNLYYHLGNIKAEILEYKNEFQDTSTENTIFITKNCDYDIQCANCRQKLSQIIAFQRILPLPSDQSDPNEWFCHNDSSNNNEALTPSLVDLFYSLTYAFINENLLAGVTRSGTNIMCKRCLAWIGMAKKPNTHKIWFHTVVFSDKKGEYKSEPLDDFLKTVRDVINGSLLGTRKILLSCQISQTEVNYLLVWVIEKKLKVCLHIAPEKFGVQNLTVAKVFFKFNSKLSSAVGEWQNDLFVVNIAVSKCMMIAAIKYLYTMNKHLSRDTFFNDFYVSYLPLYEKMIINDFE